LATSCIDVSDGLSSDLGHLAKESGVGFVIDAASLPGNAPLGKALHGGEQYELLFTAKLADREQVARLAHDLRLELTRIGSVEGVAGELALRSEGRTEPLVPAGWNHFGVR
jgi:thiamine-monophosphate kinase